MTEIELVKKLGETIDEMTNHNPEWDKNLSICIVGPIGFARKIFPEISYEYEAGHKIGPVELEFSVTHFLFHEREIEIVESKGIDQILILPIKKLKGGNEYE